MSTLLHRIAVSTFPHLFQMCSKWRSKAFEIEARGCLWRKKTGRREVYKTRQKTSIRKVRQYVQNVPKKGPPKSDFFVVFWGLWPKAFQGGPKDPPEHPTRSNLVEILTKSGARNWIYVMFYWVLSQTEPTCPKVLPRCFQMFPDASRVLIRVICEELPTRRQEKTNKNKNIHFQFDGILTVLVRRPCASSKHRLD